MHVRIFQLGRVDRDFNVGMSTKGTKNKKALIEDKSYFQKNKKKLAV